MANKKMTKRDYFEAIKSKYALTDEEKAFIDHELELLDKKNASKSTKATPKQKENMDIKEKILAEMVAGERYTISEMIKTLPCCKGFQNQKISALVRQLIAEGVVVRVEDKRKAYFSKV